MTYQHYDQATDSTFTFEQVRREALRAIKENSNLNWVAVYNELAEKICAALDPYQAQQEEYVLVD